MNPIKIHRGPISGKVREVALKHVARAHWDKFMYKDGRLTGFTITFRVAPRWHAHTFTSLNNKVSYQKRVFTPKGWKTTKIKAVDFR